MERSDLDDILLMMLQSREKDTSDLNFTVHRPLQVELAGKLTEVSPRPALAFGYLSPYQTATAAFALMHNAERLFRNLFEQGSCDLAYALRDKARFRVNIFSTKRAYSIVLRKLETSVPTLEDIKAPLLFKEVVKEKNGLILVTGATGSGKSTTLAAMLRELNEAQAIHIVTLEDPIEFSHHNIRATFNQRELGTDFDNFPSGLRAALRQGPKVILVGELRDRQTMEIALTAAETGHLVLSTLHTVNAGQTINRIVGMFEKEQEEQIRTRLSETLRWIICQRLIPRKDGGRVAAHEIMGHNLRISELIEQGEDEVKTYFDVIEASEHLGWQTFESCLLRLYDNGIINETDALLNSNRKNIMLQKIDYIKNKKGQKSSELQALQIDEDYVNRVLTEIQAQS